MGASRLMNTRLMEGNEHKSLCELTPPFLASKLFCVVGKSGVSSADRLTFTSFRKSRLHLEFVKFSLIIGKDKKELLSMA